MPSLINFLRKFTRDDRGQFAIWTALVATPLILAAGGSIDISAASTARRGLQEAADSAALAGARQLMSTPSDANSVSTKSQDYFQSNAATLDADGAQAAVTVDLSAGKVTVKATASQANVFLGMIGIHSTPVSATAVAGVALRPNSGGGCIISMSHTEKSALLLSGGSRIDAPGCTVWVNSENAASTTVSGGSSITAKRNCLYGGVSQGLSNISAAPVNCGRYVDPFTSKVIAYNSGCDFTKFKGSGTLTMQPGVYCGGVTLSGGPTVTLAPGKYIIKNGTFTMSGGGSMTGNGVTIVLVGSTVLNWSGTGAYNLKAPTTGDTAGFVIFQEAIAYPGGQTHISGGGSSYYEGVIYFPTQELLVSGGGYTNISPPFTVYMADIITYTGGGRLQGGLDPDRTTVPIPSEIYSAASETPRLLH